MLAKTLEDPHAPEAGAARDLLDMAVLPEIFGLDIIARGQAAAGTVGVIIGEHVLAERAETWRGGGCAGDACSCHLPTTSPLAPPKVPGG